MKSAPTLNLAQTLGEMVSESSELMAALRLVRSLGLQSWCIGAGAVRSLVWDKLHGYEYSLKREDIDVAHFDVDANPEWDKTLEARLLSAMPALRWEVTNQAGVHHWFASALGQQVPALESLEAGIATWPEFATCVGVYLNQDDSIGIVAPHGLNDLFELRVRHNPARASAATYRQRVQSKQFLERWPLLQISNA